MKKICALLLLGACTSTPKKEDPFSDKESSVLVVGTETAPIINAVTAEPYEEDWKKNPNTSCITHLYQCEYNEQGKVTQLKVLDLSEPTFQLHTEKALKGWDFASGRAGTCYVQTIYERGQFTRALVVPRDIAETMVSNLQKNRAAMPKVDINQPMPTGLKQTKPEMPREMALKGQSGYIVVNYDLDPEGVPINLKVVDEEPKGALQHSAFRSIKQWRWAKLADEPNSRRNITSNIQVYVVGSGRPLSTCDVGLKLNRLAEAQLQPQENTTGPRQAPKPSLK